MPRLTKLFAGLPPAVLTDDDARIELVVETGSGTHGADRGLERYPATGADIAGGCRLGVHFQFRMQGSRAQAWNRAMLRLAENRWLGAGQRQRIAGRSLRRRRTCAPPRFCETRQGRLPVLGQRLRPDLDLA